MLRIQVTFNSKRREFNHVAGPFEIGRGAMRDNIPRCEVGEDSYLSTHHVRLLELAEGQLRVENHSTRNVVRVLTVNEEIKKSDSRDLTLPIRLQAGQTVIDVETYDPLPEEGDTPLSTVAFPIVRPGASDDSSKRLTDLGQSPTPETLAHWFETLIAVQRAAADSLEFYQGTARAVVELVGLDEGMVLLRRRGRWMVQARWPEHATRAGREFSQTVLLRIESEKCTLFQNEVSGSASESMQSLAAVVASPIFGVGEEVVGAVYGCRTREDRRPGIVGIGKLEAQLVQVLAAVVGVGLARLGKEAEAGRLRVQFEQFFSADLARELEKNPRLLEGQEREVTVFFTDIRGFSRLAEKLGATDTCKLVGAVMERLTVRVHETDGVIVDYTGDGLMAMWNAPKEQDDHAARACRAALAMLADLPDLNAEWQERLGAPLRFGVGVNTGKALCGNTGSKQKFKYGALGHTVNLASRVEGATKQMGVPLLISGSTRSRLGSDVAARRLRKVRVVGIDGAVDLYELRPTAAATPEWRTACIAYETALECYEKCDFVGACRSLHGLLAARQDYDDVPSLRLLARAVEYLQTAPEQFDGIWELSSK